MERNETKATKYIHNKHEVPKFLLQLFDILEAESSAVIKWSDDGTSMQILDPIRATQEILPKYFSHNNFQSFQRQLNYFGFRKWTKTKTYICTFSHPCFKKNEPEKLHFIKRKSLPKRTRRNEDTHPIDTFIQQNNNNTIRRSQTILPQNHDDTRMKVMPVDSILFQPQTLPNLNKIRSNIILRLESNPPTYDPPTCRMKLSPNSQKQQVIHPYQSFPLETIPPTHMISNGIEGDDPVHLLLGIKKATTSNSESIEYKYAQAIDEIKRLKSNLQFQIQENEHLRNIIKKKSF